MEMTRQEYAEYLADCLTDEECIRLFGLDRDALRGDGWNQALDYAWHEYHWSQGIEPAA